MAVFSGETATSDEESLHLQMSGSSSCSSPNSHSAEHKANTESESIVLPHDNETLNTQSESIVLPHYNETPNEVDSTTEKPHCGHVMEVEGGHHLHSCSVVDDVWLGL